MPQRRLPLRPLPVRPRVDRIVAAVLLPGLLSGWMAWGVAPAPVLARFQRAAADGKSGTKDAAAAANADLTPPPPGRPVTAPKAGETPLIGLHTECFDPTAKAKTLHGQIARTGVPRQPRLSAAERDVEADFADWVQEDPRRATEAALRLAQAAGSAEQPIFEVDGVKRLVPEYGGGGKAASPEEYRFRLEHNHALHPTAVAVARLAFIERLDELAALPEDHPRKRIFVTNGGCAAGKGSLTGIVKDALGDKATFGAVWDAAGEGDALENAWILRAALHRGISVVYGYAEANPVTRYQGVLERGEDTGRVVDVMTFVNSYADGAAVFRDFLGSAEYEQAVSADRAAAFGINPGEFDLGSLTDKSKPAFPNLRNLSPEGTLRPDNIAPPPDRQAALEASLEILEEYVAKARAAGKDPLPVARGALDNAIKFLDDQPPEVRAVVRASHGRIFGGQQR
jgi:hypothetical protein